MNQKIKELEEQIVKLQVEIENHRACLKALENHREELMDELQKEQNASSTI